MPCNHFKQQDLSFYMIILAIVVICYATIQLLINLFKKYSNTIDSISSNSYKVSPITKDQPGWSDKQRETTKQFGLLNDRILTPDEAEIARRNGLLNNNNNNNTLTHQQFQKAKQLQLI
jgi:hypothetical protein